MGKHTMSVSDLKKKLSTYSQEQLISIMIDCYKLNDDVKKYLEMEINPEEATKRLYEQSKIIITNEFFPQRGFAKLRLSVAKKAISDFRKISNDQLMTLDLMLYYVEMGVRFTKTYGDMYESFYNSMMSMYDSIVKKIINEENPSLYMQYKERLKSIVDNVRNTGWGFHEGLWDSYSQIELEFEYEMEEDLHR